MDCIYYNYEGDCIMRSLFGKSVRCDKSMDCVLREPLPVGEMTDEDLLRHEKKMIADIAEVMDCKNCLGITNKERDFIKGIRYRKVTLLSSKQLKWVHDIYGKI